MPALKSKLPVYVEVSEYEVSVLPEGFRERWNWVLQVVRRGPDSWAVVNGGYCYSRRGEPSYERLPSARTDRWKKSHRFPLEEALDIARRIAPKMTVNGCTAAEWMARVEAAA